MREHFYASYYHYVRPSQYTWDGCDKLKRADRAPHRRFTSYWRFKRWLWMIDREMEEWVMERAAR